jgi:hypothetical protein
MPAEILHDGWRLRWMRFKLIPGIPLERQMHNAAWLGDFSQRTQSTKQPLEMVCCIPRQPQC